MEKYLEDLIMELQKPSTFEEVQNKQLLGEIPQFGSMFGYLQEHEEEKKEALNTLLCALDGMDVYKACCISHFCGYLIEKIGMTEACVRLVDFYAKSVRLGSAYLESAGGQLEISGEEFDSSMEDSLDKALLFEQKPDEVKAFNGLDMATLAVMDVITRSPECRLRLRKSDIYGDMEALEGLIGNIFYPLQVHEACWTLPVVILNFEAGYGFEAQINDLNNNFQLLAFLEQEIARQPWAEDYGLSDKAFRQNIYDYLNGSAYPKEQGSVNLHMSYTSWDGTMIWGEMPPESIPVLDEKAVILMERNGIARSFDIQFILKWHEALNPYFMIQRQLTPDQVKQWENKIKEQRKLLQQ